MSIEKYFVALAVGLGTVGCSDDGTSEGDAGVRIEAGASVPDAGDLGSDQGARDANELPSVRCPDLCDSTAMLGCTSEQRMLCQSDCESAVVGLSTACATCLLDEALPIAELPGMPGDPGPNCTWMFPGSSFPPCQASCP